MPNVERGLIRNRSHAQQIRDFSGLRFGKITPTDIDGFIEFGDRLFIFMESKFGGAAPPYGQSLAFERLCDCCAMAGKTAAFLLLSHHVEVSDVADIDFGNLIVSRFRFDKKWHVPKAETTCRTAVEKFIEVSQKLSEIEKCNAAIKPLPVYQPGMPTFQQLLANDPGPMW
jgi:hypothetical protein